MIIRFACPHGHRLTAAGSSAGLRGQCPLCLATVCVPVAQPKPSGKVKKVWNAGPVLRDLESFAEEALSDIGVDEDDPVPESAFVPLDEAPSSVAAVRTGHVAARETHETGGSRAAPSRAAAPESSSRMAPLKWDAIPSVPVPSGSAPVGSAPASPAVPATPAVVVPPVPAPAAPERPSAIESGSSSRLAPLKWDDAPAAASAPAPSAAAVPFPPSPFVGPAVPGPAAPVVPPAVPAAPTVPDPLAPSPFAAPSIPSPPAAVLPAPLGGALPARGVPDPLAPSPFARPATIAEVPGEVPAFFPVGGMPAPKPVDSPILIETAPEKKSLRELAGPARLRKTALTALAMLAFAAVTGLPTQAFLPDFIGMPPWAKVLTFLAVAQATYAVFTFLVPDWSTIWLGTVLHAGLAAMYGIGWILARFTAPDAPMVFALQEVRPHMPFWCFVMGISALGLGLLFGRFAYTWRRDFELDLKRAALERRRRSVGGVPTGMVG